MTSQRIISPFFSRALSSNGDSSSEEDDVFINSRLDVISRNCDDQVDENGDYIHSGTAHFLDFKIMGEPGSIPLFTPSPRSDESAVIFSVYFSGKYFGEVGLFEPDISILDWLGFRAYIFSSLNLESFENYVISYCDEDGDKLPIESEDDYQEALKIAKLKASEEEKLLLFITRTGGGGFQSSLRSLVSSSLRRVNSVGGGSARTGTALQPLKKDVTTSTSFHSLDKENSNNSIELHSEEISQSYAPLHNHHRDLLSPQENYFGDATEAYEKNVYDSPLSSSNHHHQGNAPQRYSSSTYLATNNSWNADEAMAGQDLDMSVAGVPAWFRNYMKQFKEDLSIEVSSKIDERFEEAVGSISATDVASKLKGLLTGYCPDAQGKSLCCCKNSNGPCQRSFQLQSSFGGGSEHAQHIGGLESLAGKLDRDQLSTPVSVLRMDNHEDSIDGDGTNTQDYFLQKLLKREQEILDFLDSTNEKIKQKIKDSSEYTDSLRSCLTKELAIEERERVLARIEDFRQRQSRTTNDIKMLQQSMEVNNEGMLRLTGQETLSSPPKDFDAKFVKDLSFADGSKVCPNQCFRKHWAVQNTGRQPWDREVYLLCQSNNGTKPFNPKIKCPPLLPGEVGRISADFQAPPMPGIYSTEWRFAHRDRLFGNHLWCSVIVPTENGFSSEESDAMRLVFENSEEAGLQEADNPYFTDYMDYFGDENFLDDEHLDGDVENPRILDDNENPPNKEENPHSSVSVEEDLKKSGGAFPMHPLRQMNSEQLLWFLLYVFRITKPNFNEVRGTSVYKAVSDFVTKGREKDFNNACLMIENSFLENCAEGNLKLEQVLKCYNDLFGTDEESEKRIQQVTFRYLHKMFSPPERGFELSDGEVDTADDHVKLLDTSQGDSSCEVVTTDSPATFGSEMKENSRVSHEERKTTTLGGADDLGKSSSPLRTQNLAQKCYEGEKKSDFEEGSAVMVQKVINFIETLSKKPWSHSHDLVLKKMEEQRENLTGGPERHKTWEKMIEGVTLNSDSLVSGQDDEDELDHTTDDNENERSFCRLNEDDCEDEVSSSYSEYSESESSLESEDEDASLKVIKGAGDKSAHDCESDEEECDLEIILDESEHENEDDLDQEVVVDVSEHEDDDSDQEVVDESENENEEDHEVIADESDYESEHENEEECEQEIVADESERDTEDYCDQEVLADEGEHGNEEESACDSALDHESDNESEIGHESDNEGSENEGVLNHDSDLESEENEKDDESENEDESLKKDEDNCTRQESKALSEGEIPPEEDNQRNSSEDQQDQQAASCSKEDSNREEDMKPPVSDLKKDIMSLIQNYKQNVEVQLDFEVISTRMPAPEERPLEFDSSNVSDPLTFQEKHFTISSRPPPEPVKITESDDESFDGVFITDTDIPSSVPPTEPGSPTNPQPPPIDDSELSASCSSFSELDEDDDDVDAERSADDRGGSTRQNPESSSMASSFTDYLTFGFFSSTPPKKS